jgi:hypothetical protein
MEVTVMNRPAQRGEGEPAGKISPGRWPKKTPNLFLIIKK